ncbi:ATP-dependent zinc protease family protein [Marinobacter halophilus]|uniref:ATP-dependent zinc protease n=1 Tax=Marinobacter halophilus TaxID=1323740 RepID=A0A2T1K9X4_9GAMM|nr:RimK/LysX family protein [Marinobacter halophilus]PSF06818.1 ATP-dependent zinc protease [Marinobacter halophilus]GGC75804.1 ATP-dependent Zn protease [Marinobacter halophilus]
MGYKFFRPRRFIMFAIPGLALVLAGCSADRYFMVPKDGVEDIRAAVHTQRATLVTMENNATVRQEQLLQHNQTATQSILDAISTQVERPSCPPAVQPVCPSVSEDRGRADRLKGKVIVGELEKFYLAGPGHIYTARIDSGAETSSIHARNVKRFERDGGNWVRFEVPVPGADGEWATMEREISRRVRVIQASAEEAERRVVVELQFAIGDHQQVAEFTLADRANLTYEVLIGRNILRDVMLIDVGKEFATELPDSYRERATTGDDS